MATDHTNLSRSDYQNLSRAEKIANLAARKAAQNGGAPPPTDPWGQDVPASDVPLQPEPEPAASDDDHKAIRSHVAMLHELAGNAGVDGILTFTRFDAKGSCDTERFAIGDAEYMSDAIIGWNSHSGLSLYLPWVIWREDLEHGAKGAEADIRAGCHRTRNRFLTFGTAERYPPIPPYTPLPDFQH
jgi:hypothetical protein